jgi:acetate kinase
MNSSILVLNTGSSSIKFSLFLAAAGGALELLLRGQISGLGGAARFEASGAQSQPVARRHWPADASLDHADALAYLLEFLLEHTQQHALSAVGHRVVHGGLTFAAPVYVTEAILSELKDLVPLAPLHQPHNLAPMRILSERMPTVAQVACFDTAFHRHQPEIAQRYALPRELTDAGIRAYGFHGLSYEYVAAALPEFDSEAAHGRVAVLHLGNGASMCALLGGRSIATTMGFTALDGLPMGTRCGSLDPGVLLYLLQQHGMSISELEQMLYRRSGLLGVSGLASDMRELLEADTPGARLAVELFVYRIGRELGSLAAALGGLDALVFTAGIGENSAAIRARVCAAAAWLGVELDPEANAANQANARRISTAASATSAWVIPTNEELMIARHTRAVLQQR